MEKHWQMLPECKLMFEKLDRLESRAFQIFLAFVIQILLFAATWGELRFQVKINTDRLTHLEEIHPRVATLTNAK